MNNPSYSSVIKLTQTISPTLLNETAFFTAATRSPSLPSPARRFICTAQRMVGNQLLPAIANNLSRLPEIQLQGTPLNVNWSSSYFPWKNGYEGFEPRDDLSWTKGLHQFKFGFSWLHDYKNQQLQHNTQGTATFNSSNFSGDSYINFLLGDATSFQQLQLSVRQTLGQQQLWLLRHRQLASHSPTYSKPGNSLRRNAACL